MDPRQTALTELDALLSRGREQTLSTSECMHLVELVHLVPGRIRAIVDRLAAQRDASAVEALLQLRANVPGVVEGVFQALVHGTSRKRLDGSSCPRFLAVDFRHSRARDFPDVLARAAAVFDTNFERLRIKGAPHYRFGLREGRGTLAGHASAVAHDLQWLHRRVGKLRGSRLWINGWCFASSSGFGPAIQVHWVHAWLHWASQQLQTRRGEHG